jgi:hypothetical protein
MTLVDALLDEARSATGAEARRGTGRLAAAVDSRRAQAAGCSARSVTRWRYGAGVRSCIALLHCG